MSKTAIFFLIVLCVFGGIGCYLLYDVATPGMVEIKRRHVEVYVENGDGSLFVQPNLYLNAKEQVCFDVNVVNNNSHIIELKLDCSPNIQWNYNGELIAPREWMPLTLTITDPYVEVYFYIYGWEHYEQN